MAENKENQNSAHGRNTTNTAGVDTGEAVGTAGGVVAGAAVGSLLGPLGTVAGGIAGGMLGNKVGEGAGGATTTRKMRMVLMVTTTPRTKQNKLH
ncbi:hypothetical protein [Paenibacillus sp. N3.4]|uniref:hypothetical protein n=1 Tax=Paenibacillus sp. N3.4 TaxID=2603222 RepID=UPI0021C34B3E|nr:hypothetical protein [Paenibacillus sp. N3.4]